MAARARMSYLGPTRPENPVSETEAEIMDEYLQHQIQPLVSLASPSPSRRFRPGSAKSRISMYDETTDVASPGEVSSEIFTHLRMKQVVDENEDLSHILGDSGERESSVCIAELQLSGTLNEPRASVLPIKRTSSMKPLIRANIAKIAQFDQAMLASKSARASARMGMVNASSYVTSRPPPGPYGVHIASMEADDPLRTDLSSTNEYEQLLRNRSSTPHRTTRPSSAGPLRVTASPALILSAAHAAALDSANADTNATTLSAGEQLASPLQYSSATASAVTLPSRSRSGQRPASAGATRPSSAGAQRKTVLSATIPSAQPLSLIPTASHPALDISSIADSPFFPTAFQSLAPSTPYQSPYRLDTSTPKTPTRQTIRPRSAKSVRVSSTWERPPQRYLLDTYTRVPPMPVSIHEKAEVRRTLQSPTIVNFLPADEMTPEEASALVFHIKHKNGIFPTTEVRLTSKHMRRKKHIVPHIAAI
eukprot:TRINITY_DN12043_c0_g1_i1.p1 TRINITY_DN12043_c0_g1~~TRINITY_DN12043_c0_g1_i1.p1  ORF type:complete len:479 (-),score=86.37 TRINITY_DN12043_c0_g1_i1:69-1505(-)